MAFIHTLIRPRAYLKRKGKYILTFLHGFLLASLAYFFVEQQYEDKLFTSISGYVQASVDATTPIDAAGRQDSLLVKSLHVVHDLAAGRSAIFGKYPVNGIKGGLVQPVGFDLMTGQGACGSYAYILARVLQELHIGVRLPQMTVEGQPAGHIVVEAETARGWVVLDASHDVFFHKPDGQLAGFSDVKNDWAYYSGQLPSGYNMAYKYEGVRYTNWDKIPLVMPAIKNMMYWTMGKEKTDSYSLRSLMLKKYGFLFNVTAGIYLLVILFSINLWVKARKSHLKVVTA